MEELKTSADTAVMYGAHYLLSRFLPTSLYRLLMNLVNRNSSIYMANMIGPETSLSIGSHRLNNIHYFISPPSYCSIVYNIFTYDNKLYISIVTSSKLITNARELMRQFRLQIDTLHELLHKRRIPGESKRQKRPIFFTEDQLAPEIAQADTATVSHPQTLSPQPQLFGSQSPTSPLPHQLTNLSDEQISIDLSNKLHNIQDELNQLSGDYELGIPAVVERYEELKEKFSSILYELRRRKSLADFGGNVILINIQVYYIRYKLNWF